MARRNAHFSKTASTLNKKASNSTVKAGAAALLVGVTVYSTFYGAKIWTNRHEDIPKHAREEMQRGHAPTETSRTKGNENSPSRM
ncbi:hypothetical protein CC1G_03594 [Coprinopsis cinerea okayama7|uniref:Uncharacterized protein n=1 Tax=Coprinopsis cinerea (strain Okayama-7 / 130 / ATCC MYA-4618 / FGSC 9003) TaxID=240176 RepID=A8NCN6_COPC7|nr:hypothetical protein CC1G_03594 [Coprinopsis cinerea okayama7\|eukprot:XP_001832580.2 hypothetical protein CC1G_03594 [Coprinopsis cinerea okayama7\